MRYSKKIQTLANGLSQITGFKTAIYSITNSTGTAAAGNITGRLSVHIAITCKTDRFNLSVVGEDFINDCCYGEDFSTWLVTALATVGVDADLICMEDFGWANHASFQGSTYLMCVAGNADEDPARPNFGTWHIMLERHRTLLEKILVKNKTAATEPIFEKIIQLLQNEGFTDVAIDA